MIEFLCDPESVVITLRDESGWFLADSPRKLEGLGGLIARGEFDEVTYNEASRQVVMTHLFATEV